MTTEQREDVVTLLLAQHEQIKGLIERVETTHGEAKREAFEDLVRMLAIHETAEEEVVHPASRRASVSDSVVDSRLHEENEAKHVLSELYDMGVLHEGFDTKFRTFANSVVEHAEMEEKEEFGQLAQQTSADERKKLSDAVRVAEAVAPTRPHPHAGESAIANIIAGPPLALFDRVRDAVRDWRRKTEE
ncbi:hemerythrin domain-containing protein [Nocardia arthritidis]|uniref:Hemerythrin domain-containing protein n=1 Tax=Nocardia arthritidis TaxID=228602 RepID=A0A6G9YM95_9NOCA|nr:hemerythrin domain-containing protein [Nocardia arthritidis]QIS14425.1 hemerythrin domain-containing protein [Nocardia arthritidis]